MRILIVDDEPLQREALRSLEIWKDEGCEVAEAIHGRDALAYLSDNPVDILLTDIRMPVMDGVSLTREVKSRYPEIRIVMLSAYGDFHLVKESFQIGADDYLLKAEFQESQLRDIVERFRRETRFSLEKELRPREFLPLDIFRQAVLEHSVQVLEWLNAGDDSRFVCFGFKFSRGDETFMRSFGKRLSSMKALPVKIDAARISAVVAVPAGFEYGHLEEELHTLTGQVPDGVEWAAGINPVFPNIQQVPQELDALTEELEMSFFRGWNRWLHVLPHKNETLPVYHVLETMRGEILRALSRKSFTSEDICGLDLNVPSSRISRESINPVRNYFRWVSSQFQDFVLDNHLSDDPGLHALLKDFNDGIRGEGSLAVLNTWQRRIFKRLATAGENRNNLVVRAKDYVRSLLPGHCTVADVAHHLGVSPEHLSRTFRRSELMSVKSFITGERITIARKLLSGNELKIYEIAEESGFSSVEHFSRTFKKVTGYSPKEYLQH